MGPARGASGDGARGRGQGASDAFTMWWARRRGLPPRRFVQPAGAGGGGSFRRSGPRGRPASWCGELRCRRAPAHEAAGDEGRTLAGRASFGRPAEGVPPAPALPPPGFARAGGTPIALGVPPRPLRHWGARLRAGGGGRRLVGPGSGRCVLRAATVKARAGSPEVTSGSARPATHCPTRAARHAPRGTAPVVSGECRPVAVSAGAATGPAPAPRAVFPEVTSGSARSATHCPTRAARHAPRGTAPVVSGECRPVAVSAGAATGPAPARATSRSRRGPMGPRWGREAGQRSP